MDNNFKMKVGIEVDSDGKKIQSQIDNKVKNTTVKTALEITANNKKIQEEIAKIKKEVLEKFNIEIDDKTALKSIQNTQKAYQELRKEIYQGIGKKPQILQDMAKYYTELQAESERTSTMVQKSFTEMRKEAYQGIGTKSKELTDMASYYSKLEKDSDSFSKKNLNGIDLEIKKREEQSRLFSSQIKSQMQERVSAENKIQAELKQTAKEQQGAFKLDEGKLQTFNRIGAYISNNTKLTKEQIYSLKELQTSISNVNDKSGLDQIKTKFSSIKSEANAMGTVGDTMFARLKKNSVQFLNYLGSATIIMGSIRTFQKIVDEVKNIDSAMISLKKVTDETDSTYERFLTNTAQRAKELGASISDLINATADFARLGYNLPDASKLGEVATLYKNVGDGININEATSSIISTLKAFNIEAENSISIVDKFNEVGNNFAISSVGIGDALQKSASALASANNTLDESIALITAGNNVVQDPDMVGTALKTVSLRLRSTATEIKNLGEDADGAVENVSKLRDLLLTLTKQKVDIQLDEDTYKSTYEIMLEMSKVWDSMTDMSQASALEAMFGKRQANIGASILQNMTEAEKVLKTSIESSGSALREQEKYQEGIQYSLDRLKASMQELSMTTLDSSVIKFIVDLANGAVNATTAIGGLVPVVTTLGIAFGVHKFLLPILVKEMSALLLAETGVTATTMSQIVAQTGLNGAVALGTTAIRANTTALLTWMASNPVGWILALTAVVGGVVLAYNELNVTLEENQETLSELKGKYDSISSEVETLESKLEAVQSRMKELEDIKPLSFVEDDEYQRLSNSNDELERRLTIQRELQKIAGREAEEQAIINISQASEHSLNPNNYRTTTSAEGLTFTQETKISRMEAIQERIDAYNKLQTEYDGLIKKQVALAEAGKTETTEFTDLTKEIDKNTEKRQTYRDYILTTTQALNTESDSIVGATDEGIEYAKAIDDLGINVDNFISSSTDASDAITEVTESTDEASESLSAFSTSTFDTLNKSLDDLDKKSKDTVSSIKELNQVLYDQSQGTKLTSEQAYKLITQYPQLASALEKTTDGYAINEEAIDDVREALINQETANANAQLNMTRDTLDAVKDRVEAYGIELEAITNIQSATSEQGNLPWQKIFGTMDGVSFNDETMRVTNPMGSFIAQSKEQYDKMKQSYQEQKLIYDTVGKMGNLKERINGLQSGLLSDSGFGVNEDKGNKGKEKDPIKDAFDKKKNDIDHLLAMDEITQEDYYNRLEKLNEKHYGKNKKTHLEQYRQYLEEVYKGRKSLEFSETIDWASMSLQRLQDDVDIAQNKLDNTEGYQAQIDAINELIEAQEALKAGYQSSATLYKSQYDNVKGIDKYKTMIETGATFELVDITDKKLRESISNAVDYFNKWRDSLNKIDSTTKSISKNYQEINNVLDSTISDIENIQGRLANSIKKENQEQYDNRLKHLRKMRDLDVKYHNDKIALLEEEIKRIQGNTIPDKLGKLSKLQGNYQEWLSDDSTLGKAKQKELRDQIAELDKEIQIDKLEEKIKSERDIIEDINDKFDKAIDEDSENFDAWLKTYKDRMSDQKAYEKANALMLSGNQEEIERLIKTFDPVYSGIATLMGETAGSIIAKAVTAALEGLGLLKGGGGGSYGSSGTTTSSYSDGTPVQLENKALSILSSGGQGNSSEGLSKLNQYVTGQGYDVLTKVEMVELAKNLGVKGINSVADVGTDADGRWNKNQILDALIDKGYITQYAIGGETTDDGVAYLHKNERVLTVEQTNAFNKLVYDYIPNMFDSMTKGSMIDKSAITNRNVTFNRELVSYNVDKIVNYTPFDAKNEQDNLNRMFTKSLQKSGINTKL